MSRVVNMNELSSVGYKYLSSLLAVLHLKIDNKMQTSLAQGKACPGCVGTIDGDISSSSSLCSPLLRG